MALSWGWLKGKFARKQESCPECDAALRPKETYCTVCGYDLVRQTRDDVIRRRGSI